MSIHVPSPPNTSALAARRSCAVWRSAHPRLCVEATQAAATTTAARARSAHGRSVRRSCEGSVRRSGTRASWLGAVASCSQVGSGDGGHRGIRERYDERRHAGISYRADGGSGRRSCSCTEHPPTTAAAARLAAVQERFSVLAVDRRGRGRSGDAETYAVEREFEDVAAVADGLGQSTIALGTPTEGSARWRRRS